MSTESSQKLKVSLFRRYPLISFFALSYLFFAASLAVIGAVVSLTNVSVIAMGLLIAFGSWTPNAAAVVVVRATEGKAGVKRLFAGWARWRVSGWWYLFGLAPIGLALAISVLYSLLGGAGPQVTTDFTVSSLAVMLLLHTIQGATGEELGWRGFALPKLQNRFCPLVSALILGAAVSGWHGILHLVSPTGIPEWQFVLLLLSYSVIVTWAYNKTRGSVLIATIFHFAFNFSLELVSTRLGLIPLEQLFMFRVIVYAAVAILLIVITGKNLSREQSGTESHPAVVIRP